MGQKFFWVKTIRSKKIGSEFFLGQTKFGLEIFLGPKKLGPKKFWVKKNLGQKFFWVKCGQTNFYLVMVELGFDNKF